MDPNTQVHGIEKTKAGITTVLSTFDTISEKLADGAQVEDLLAILPLVPAINKTIKDVPEIKKELGELSDVELNDLLGHFKAKFNLPNAGLALLIEDMIDYVVDTVAHAKRGISIAKRLKELKSAA